MVKEKKLLIDDESIMELDDKLVNEYEKLLDEKTQKR